MRTLSNHYVLAAVQRVGDARLLWSSGSYSGAIYFAGVDVESLLLAFLTRNASQFESRHDLRALAAERGILAVVSPARRQDVLVHVGTVWARWKNTYRYGSDERLRVEIRRLGLDRGVRGDPLKQNARLAVNSALDLVTMGGKLWDSQST